MRERTRTRLRRRHRIEDTRGLSEIVGALMLTVIVVVAAASFAVFLSQRQQEVQNQQIYALHKQQELITVDSLTPTIEPFTDNVTEMNFTISSNHQLESTITRIAVDGHVLKEFWMYRFNETSLNWERNLLHWNDRLVVEPREQLYMNVSAKDFFESGLTFNDTRIIKLEISTNFQNTFTGIFMPPSAIVAMKTEALWNGSAYQNYLVLDGSGSAPQSGASIVYYDWNITRKAGGDSFELHGVKTTVQFHNTGEYWLNLTVTDSHGMVGRDSLLYNQA